MKQFLTKTLPQHPGSNTLQYLLLPSWRLFLLLHSLWPNRKRMLESQILPGIELSISCLLMIRNLKAAWGIETTQDFLPRIVISSVTQVSPNILVIGIWCICLQSIPCLNNQTQTSFLDLTINSILFTSFLAGP